MLELGNLMGPAANVQKCQVRQLDRVWRTIAIRLEKCGQLPFDIIKFLPVALTFQPSLPQCLFTLLESCGQLARVPLAVLTPRGFLHKSLGEMNSGLQPIVVGTPFMIRWPL
jgi:hypothetical protein